VSNYSLKVGVEESIVNAPLVSLQSKNINNAKSEVSFTQLIRRLVNAYFEVKFKKIHDTFIMQLLF
jgi:hypothetical protein